MQAFLAVSYEAQRNLVQFLTELQLPCPSLLYSLQLKKPYLYIQFRHLNMTKWLHQKGPQLEGKYSTIVPTSDKGRFQGQSNESNMCEAQCYGEISGWRKFIPTISISSCNQKRSKITDWESRTAVWTKNLEHKILWRCSENGYICTIVDLGHVILKKVEY